MDSGTLGLSGRSPREDEFWTPEPIWKDQPAFVLASGPSLTRDICEQLEGLNTLAVNSTAPTIATEAAAWFFTDNGVWDHVQKKHAAWLDSYSGLIVSMSRKAKREAPDRVKRVSGVWSPDFPPLGSSMVRQGRSSGQTAISVAYAMGARPIYLLGFNMKAVDGREHHHDEYQDRPRDLDVYDREFLPAFAGWNDAARARDVPIYNATSGSALKEFPFVTLDEVLACAA